MINNSQQREYWNGPAGEKWAILADNQDKMLGHLGETAMEAVDLTDGNNVLDIGCGSGGTTFEISRRVGSTGKVMGIDISEPMLAIAKARSAANNITNVEFSEADVTTFDFSTHIFERAFSRFGVMFFEDPIASFSNFASSIAAGGKIAFCCWRDLKYNEWFEFPLNVGLKYCPPPEKSDPNAPGPLAFKEKDRIQTILSATGFTRIAIENYNSKLVVGPTPKDAAKQLSEFGPLYRLLANATDTITTSVRNELSSELEEFLTPDGVKLGASIWIVSAYKK